MTLAVPAFMVDVEDPHEWAEKHAGNIGELMRLVEDLSDGRVYVEYLFSDGTGWREVARELDTDIKIEQYDEAAKDFGENLRAVYVYGSEEVVLEEYVG